MVGPSRLLAKSKKLLHLTFMYLGDIARYRYDCLPGHAAVSLVDSAKVYYLLAAVIYPQSGRAMNQLAWTASCEGQTLAEAVYRSRSFLVKQPFPVNSESAMTSFFEEVCRTIMYDIVRIPIDAEDMTLGQTRTIFIHKFLRLHAVIAGSTEATDFKTMLASTCDAFAAYLHRQADAGMAQEEEAMEVILLNLAAVTPYSTEDRSTRYYFAMDIFFSMLEVSLTNATRQTSATVPMIRLSLAWLRHNVGIWKPYFASVDTQQARCSVWGALSDFLNWHKSEVVSGINASAKQPPLPEDYYSRGHLSLNALHSTLDCCT